MGSMFRWTLTKFWPILTNHCLMNGHRPGYLKRLMKCFPCWSFRTQNSSPKKHLQKFKWTQLIEEKTLVQIQHQARVDQQHKSNTRSLQCDMKWQSASRHWDQMPEEKAERYIWAHGSRGFRPWWTGSIAGSLGQAEASWQKGTGEETAHLMIGKQSKRERARRKGRGQNGVPRIVPSWPTSIIRPLLPRGLHLLAMPQIPIPPVD